MAVQIESCNYENQNQTKKSENIHKAQCLSIVQNCM